MLNKTSLVLCCLMVLFVFSCSYSDPSLKEVNLVEEFSLQEFGDDLFIANVHSILYNEKKIYLIDSQINKLTVIDEQGDIIRSFGVEGKGPGEMLYPVQIYLKEDTLIIYNSDKQTFDLFSDDKYISTIGIRNTGGEFFGGRFTTVGQSVLFSAPRENSSLIKMSVTSDEKSEYFGNIKTFATKRQTIFQNHRMVFVHNKTIVAVPYSLPQVERYTLDGKLISVLSYDGELPFMHERIEEANINLQQENVVYNFVADSYVKDDDAYLLMLSKEEGKIYSNKVVVIDLSGDNMELKEILNLGPGWHNTISVSDRHLWAIRSIRGDKKLVAYKL